MVRACISLSLLLATQSVSSAQQLSFSEVSAVRRPSISEVEAQVLLAEARRAASGGRSRIADAPVLSVAGGPRRDEDGEAQADVGVGLELPLLNGRANRADLSALVDEASGTLIEGAQSLAAADLAAAFVDVWLAQTSAEVRQEDLATAEAWLESARQRVQAGADPPYEPTLVAGERDRALVELVAVRRDLELAWGELAALADIGPAPRPVTLDGLPIAPEATSATEGAAAFSISAREALAVGLARVGGAGARSRWALASELATEGQERLAHVGMNYRFPLRGERAAIDQQQTAVETQAVREAERERVALRARITAARAALAVTTPALDPTDLVQAQQALTTRLTEGKERPSEILPLRRQLLEARLAGLAARAAQAKAAAELHYLLGGSPNDAP